ncbi:MAG: hypothetical protein ACRESE_07875 [Gammaproteobacteria bacterium]
MKLVNSVFIAAGILATIYGAMILWSAAISKQDARQDDWLHSDEIIQSKFNKMEHLRHMLQPERRSISFSRSKARGYAMVVIGIVLIVFAFT